MKRVITGALFLSLALFASDSAKSAAKSAIKQLGEGLKGELVSRMKEDQTGLKAVEFCSESAQRLTKEINEKLGDGASVRRTALKVRNPVNLPSDEDVSVLEELKSRVEKGEDPNTLIKIIEKEQTVVAYKAVVVEKGCLKCHGDEKNINPDVLSVINKKYPLDKARNFKEGDFRGAIVATIQKR